MSSITSQGWIHPANAAPRELRAWLRHADSLTARLMTHFPQFNVRLLRQTWAAPHRDELQAMDLAYRDQAMVREVLLRSGETPLVFAHSIMPRSALFNGYQNLRQQGTKPLGATLFANPRISRSTLAFRRLDKRHPLYRRACATVGTLPDQLWARRSRFELGHARILVTEVFLPATLR